MPQNFKSIRTGIPVNAIQEEKLHLQKCIGEEENGKVPRGWRLNHIFELQSLVVLDTTNMRLPEVTITGASSKKCKVSLLISREVIFKYSSTFAKFSGVIYLLGILVSFLQVIPNFLFVTVWYLPKGTFAGEQIPSRSSL